MDPYLAYKEGGLMAVAIILFIANFVQNYGIKKASEALIKTIQESNTAAVKVSQARLDKMGFLTQALVDNQMQITQHLATVIQNQAALATLSRGQELTLSELSSVLKNQEVLASNLMNLTHTTNEVVRELITLIRDSERS